MQTKTKVKKSKAIAETGTYMIEIVILRAVGVLREAIANKPTAIATPIAM